MLTKSRFRRIISSISKSCPGISFYVLGNQSTSNGGAFSICPGRRRTDRLTKVVNKGLAGAKTFNVVTNCPGRTVRALLSRCRGSIHRLTTSEGLPGTAMLETCTGD